MNTQRLTTALATCLLGSAALTFAQEPVKQDAPNRRQKPARAIDADGMDAKMAGRGLFLPHTDVMGHDVVGMAGEASVAMGTVADLVVDSKDGSIRQVVIKAGETSSTPGQMRAVPYRELNWATGSEGDSTATLKLDARAFDAIPAFNPKMLDQMAGKKAVDAAAKRLDKATEGKTGAEAADVVKSARQAAAAPGRSVLASSLAGLKVYATDERAPFASVENYVINCQSGHVAFATVKAGENSYLVPLAVLKVRAIAGVDGAEETLSLVAPTNAEGMVGAPMINADNEQVATNPRFRASVYKHYGVEAPKGRRGGKKRDGANKAGDAIDQADGEIKKAVRKVKKVVDKG